MGIICRDGSGEQKRAVCDLINRDCEVGGRVTADLPSVLPASEVSGRGRKRRRTSGAADAALSFRG